MYIYEKKVAVDPHVTTLCLSYMKLNRPVTRTFSGGGGVENPSGRTCEENCEGSKRPSGEGGGGL